MKTLQNNFTNPEQSKRLLELGVPADSADCVWYNPYYNGDRQELAEISVWKGKYPQRVDKYTFPCWSVGRLIEILKICVFDKDALAEIFEELRDCVDETKSLIKIFDEYSDVLDFSKLED